MHRYEKERLYPLPINKLIDFFQTDKIQILRQKYTKYKDKKCTGTYIILFCIGN